MTECDLDRRAREKTHVTKDDIKDGVRNLGLRQGDLVVVHSSLSAFGYVEGGADAVIDALLETVGENGTVVMPSHTDLDERDFESYDPKTTPVRKNIGIIPETFWRRPDVVRGKHPARHPWAAWGLLARGLIGFSENHPLEAGYYTSMLAALADLDGHVLLLGCSNRNSTSIHSAEAAAFNQVERTTKTRVEFLRSTPKRAEDFDKLDPPLLEAGVMKMGKIGDADIRFMRSAGLFAVVKEVYERQHRVRKLTPPDDVPDPARLAEKYECLIKELKALQHAAGTAS